MWPFSRNGKQHEGARCHLCLRPDGIGFVYSSAPNQPFQLIRFIECRSPKERLLKLKQFVVENNFQNIDTIVVLIDDSYRLIQLDKPAVEDSEIVQASRWLMKDLIDFPLDDAALDVFYAPPRSNGQQKVNIVAIRQTILEDIANLVNDAGLVLVQIDISELAIHQLLLKTPEIEKGVCMLYGAGKSARILVSCEGELYLDRKISFDFSVLTQSEPDSAAIEKLALEIQRSIDFYQSQFGKQTPIKIYIDPAFQNSSSLFGTLSQSMAIPTEVFDINVFVRVAKPFDALLQSRCLPAIGAVYNKTIEELSHDT